MNSEVVSLINGVYCDILKVSWLFFICSVFSFNLFESKRSQHSSSPLHYSSPQSHVSAASGEKMRYWVHIPKVLKYKLCFLVDLSFWISAQNAHVHPHSSFSIMPFAGAGSLEQCRKLRLWKLSVSGQQLRQVRHKLRSQKLTAHYMLLFFFSLHLHDWCLQELIHCWYILHSYSLLAPHWGSLACTEPRVTLIIVRSAQVRAVARKHPSIV